MTLPKSINIKKRLPAWATAFTKPSVWCETTGGGGWNSSGRSFSTSRALSTSSPTDALAALHDDHARVQRRRDGRQPEDRPHVDDRHDVPADLHQPGDVGARARARGSRP